MTDDEFIELKILMNKYFANEFNFYRKTYGLVYEGKHIEDEEPESIFVDVLGADHPYNNLLRRLEKDMISHIKDVFILGHEPNRYQER